MNVFVPYKSPLDCAKELWNDKLRYNKQCLEVIQIIRAIEGAKPWRNHPVCLMYKEHKEWLRFYLWCFEAYRNSMKADNCTDKDGFMMEAEYYSKLADSIRPPFLTDEFCDQHKCRLYTKAPELYPQFAKYGTSEENWYYVSGQIVKYVNGKRIN